MRENVPGGKGLAAEESLRHYFLDAGYFVARGVSLQQDGQDVTDVDLWLYLRGSALHRTRTNVDVKSRQKSKAFERVLWAKGLQSVLGLDEAIIATTDKRPAVKAFAHAHGVKVLDGDFLQRLQERHVSERVSEEQFTRIVDESGMDRMRGSWRERLRTSKARLASQLDFRGCNHWMSEACYFLGRFAQHEREDTCLRALYVNLAYFHVGLDFRYQNIAFETEEVRHSALLQGFRFGEQDVGLIKEVLRSVSPKLSREVGAATSEGRENLLAQFYVENRVVVRLFDLARRFEAAAFSEQVPYPDALDTELKAVLGVIADYATVERKRVLRPANRYGRPDTEAVQLRLGSDKGP